MTRIAKANLPSGGIWRIERTEPNARVLQRPDPANDANPLGGNRFDSFSGNYGTLYFGTNLETCFAETLAEFRLELQLKVFADPDSKTMDWLRPATVPANWRILRVAVRARIDSDLAFVDINHPTTLAELNTHPELMAELSRYGVNDLDLGTVTGKDRRLTRCIAEHLYFMTDGDGQPLWNGIRYMSRHGEGRECWAVFDHAPLNELERAPIERSHPELLKVAALYGLTIH